jgi:GT2 family glycosyltransferase
MSDQKTVSQNSAADTIAYMVVSWNNKAILDDCIRSIEAQEVTGHKRIILVDNGSVDGTVEHVKKSFPSVELIAESDNHGFAKGNNIGIAKALEDPTVAYIVLLNSDARLATNWTQTLVDAAQTRLLTATMQSITLDYYDHGIIDSTHLYISRLGQGTQGSFREPLASGLDVAPQKVFGCNAAAMLITRKFIEEQPFKEFFDETMFMYLEDVDIATRATIMGWDNYVVPGTRAYHMGSASSGKNPTFSLYMTFRNNIGLMIKNLPLPILFKILIRIPRSDRASINHLRRTGKPEGIKALIKGRITSLRYIPVFLIKRRKLRGKRNIDNDYLWQLMRRGF